MRQCFVDAQAQGEIDRSASVTQATFEIEAMLMAANFLFVMTDNPIQLSLAQQGVDNVLARLAVRKTTRRSRSVRTSR